MGDNSDIFGRIPYASFIALVLSWVGVILFCTLGYQAFNVSIDQALRLLHVQISWLDRIPIVFLSLGVCMIVVSIILLILGFLSTGRTRSRTFDGVRARMGGQVSMAIFLVLAYLLHFCWLLLCVLSGITCFIYAMFSQLCASTPTISINNCLNFTVFQPIFSGVTADDNLVLCGANLQEFCALSDTAATQYYVAFGAAILVVLGLLHFLICLSANYNHVKTGHKVNELHEIWQLEENEMFPIVNNGPNTSIYSQQSINQPVRRPYDNPALSLPRSNVAYNPPQHLIKPVGRY